MNKRVIITRENIKSKEYLIAALFLDQKLMEVSCENQKDAPILGNIYIGKVKKIAKKIGAAFVETAPEQMTYLSLNDIKSAFYVKQSRKGMLTEGDELAVQVVKESVKTKSPTVSAKLTWQGEFLVLTTENTNLGISKKLPEETRNHLKNLFSDKTGSDFGLILRTNAGKYSDSVLLEEYHSILQQFTQFKKVYSYRTCYSILYQAPKFYINFLKGLPLHEVEKVVTDDKEIYEEVLDFFKGREAFLTEFYQDSMISLSNLYGLKHKVEDACKDKVWLKSGGYLVIEPTEALTVIDVNSGKSIKGNEEDYYRQVNVEAAEEIGRQLRLRNISGICIVDFINMKKKEDEVILTRTLKQILAEDSVTTSFVDFTKLGLAEITRKKEKKPLWEQFR